jgi:glycosyltransferase involved in cell wall biosynthesis
MKKIEVSFVIIAYNEETTIPRAIKSIYSQKNLGDFEVVVVDDCSKDMTFEVVSRHAEQHKEIRLFKNKTNKGRGYSRNFGVSKTFGKYIAFVDADIVLPNNWLTVCKKHIDKYDAVGGIAVPDGDVNYIYTKFNLAPKISKHTTVVTGSNGFYKSYVFKNSNFDTNQRDGEDFAFNEEAKKNKLNFYTISNLISEHRESRSFISSISWLFQSGVGSSKLLIKYKKIRLPDITFLGFLFLLLSGLYFSIARNPIFMLTIPFYIFMTSIAHIYIKFDFSKSSCRKLFFATITNSFMIFSYFLGRFYGLFKYKLQ